jgi:hypothetical protein
MEEGKTGHTEENLVCKFTRIAVGGSEHQKYLEIEWIYCSGCLCMVMLVSLDAGI